MTITNAVGYDNGNCSVFLSLNDGTKIREWEGIAAPCFPESIDLKITDYCDAGCHYCHEKSTRKGLHGSIETIFRVIDGLPSGVEIAIGGGDPLSHPHLFEILNRMQGLGLVSNLTVNQKHFAANAELLCKLQDQGLVYGIGISATIPFLIEQFKPKNLVWHVIVAISDPIPIIKMGSLSERILVLGYKHHGFGLVCNENNIVAGINKWRYWIGSLLRSGANVSFDNLALKQLGIKSIIEQDEWNNHFMGHDGKFTMYVDAVQGSYAVSSTSQRIPIAENNIRQMFSSIQ